MKNLHIDQIPDEVYEVIERRALASGRSIEEEAAQMLARDAAAEQREAELIAELKKGHEEMARRGIFASDADIQSAIEWGRE